MFGHILVPLSGAPRCEFVTTIAARLAHNTGGEVTLLRVTSGDESAPTRARAEWEARYAAASAYLSAIAAREEFAGVPTQVSVREGPVISEILAAASSGADLIIISHQHGASEQGRAHERLAERVTREASTTVLLLREPQSPLARGRSNQPCALRILVPLDGSPQAEAALTPAAALLEALGAPESSGLHLARIIPDQREWRGAARYLARVAERVRAGALTGRTLTVAWSLIPHVDPAEALTRVAELGEDTDALTTWSIARDLGQPRGGATPSAGSVLERCDLIAMTTHGRGRVRRMILGSVAERLLHGATISLMIARRPPGAPPVPSLAEEPDVEQWRA
jgi:nucleotide-binding universal stress UspA family protein